MRLNKSVKELQILAEEMRYYMIDSMHEAGSGHPGGSLSIAEVMSVLFFNEMNIKPENPKWAERDRFVLSKGHAAPALYAALACRGYFPVKELKRLRKMYCMLQGHPDCKKVPGVDISTGSLGQGISVACGMALAAKMTKTDIRVYCIIGDGESQEGQLWEAAMSASHYRLDNLTVFLDNNNLQIDGTVDKIMSIYPIKEKFNAFGWNVIKINGNDIQQIIDAYAKSRETKDRPTLILGKTVKGKGVSYMENQAGWHGCNINDEQYEIAVKEINERLEGLRKDV